jgi:HD-GYP domain-containing protein (c-di-GMP phosphodiesterase class II)
LREFAYLFVSLDPATKTLDDFRQELQTLRVDTITLEDPRDLQVKSDTVGSGSDAANLDPKQTHKAKSKSAYGHAGTAVGNLTQAVRDGGTVNFKQAKRAIQNIVDLMMQDESALLGLTTLRCHDQYTHNHSVNVALLSMALGNRAGYPKVELADLGLAALFHDMGKATIPLEVLNKPGEFTEEEWAAMRNHPTEGVLSMAQLRGITNLPARMAAASFEHHMNLDYSGYPKLKAPWKLSLTGRILTIADCYDAMTSSRVYRREPMSPSKVLNVMFKKSGTSFDATLLKLFVNCVNPRWTRRMRNGPWSASSPTPRAPRLIMDRKSTWRKRTTPAATPTASSASSTTRSTNSTPAGTSYSQARRLDRPFRRGYSLLPVQLTMRFPILRSSLPCVSLCCR